MVSVICHLAAGQIGRLPQGCKDLAQLRYTLVPIIQLVDKLIDFFLCAPVFDHFFQLPANIVFCFATAFQHREDFLILLRKKLVCRTEELPLVFE